MYLPIGERLKKLRKEAKISRFRLAELAGISCKTIINIENNKYPPTRKTSLKLIKVLNVPPATLTVNATDFFSLDIRTLKVLRLSLCLSQKEFASLCNLDSSTIRDWELGNREMNTTNKMFLSKILTFYQGMQDPPISTYPLELWRTHSKFHKDTRNAYPFDGQSSQKQPDDE